MFATWIQRINTPIWNFVGPKWYSSSWWPNEPPAAKQYALLRMLAVAHAERLEVKGLIMALADEQRGQYRRRLRTLARRLNANASLVDALERTPEVLSDHTVLALRLGAQSELWGVHTNSCSKVNLQIERRQSHRIRVDMGLSWQP